jgi:hypothetical protein
VGSVHSFRVVGVEVVEVERRAYRAEVAEVEHRAHQVGVGEVVEEEVVVGVHRVQKIVLPPRQHLCLSLGRSCWFPQDSPLWLS